MPVAVLTTEDGAFPLRHHGFDHEAIRNSIRENLRRKKFVRGASTISMQLAKNLYLDRGKNLSRKLQEAVLTMYLEQELTKDQILELYLNVVEFGPTVYGIGPAARFYFAGGSARDLFKLGQALYVASIMPNPKVQHFGPGRRGVRVVDELPPQADEVRPRAQPHHRRGARRGAARDGRARLARAPADGEAGDPDTYPDAPPDLPDDGMLPVASALRRA